MTAPATAASPILMCLCGHVARMHREDDDELCKVDGCDCTGFHRLRGPVTAPAAPKPAPAPVPPPAAVTQPTPPPSPAAAAPVPAPAGGWAVPAGTAPALECCGRTFANVNALGGHKRWAHPPDKPAAAQQERPATQPPAAAAPPPPKVEQRTPTRAAPQPAAAPQPKDDLSRHDIVLRVDLGKYGTVKIEGLQLGTPEFAALLRAVEKLVDEAADFGSAT